MASSYRPRESYDDPKLKYAFAELAGSSAITFSKSATAEAKSPFLSYEMPLQQRGNVGEVGGVMLELLSGWAGGWCTREIYTLLNIRNKQK